MVANTEFATMAGHVWNCCWLRRIPLCLSDGRSRQLTDARLRAVGRNVVYLDCFRKRLPLEPDLIRIAPPFVGSGFSYLSLYY